VDLSKEYILMCEKAEEIQKLKSLEQGNWFRKVYQDESWLVCQGEHTDSIHEKDFEDKDQQHVWLPTQDQLQEMLEGKKAIELAFHIGRFVIPDGCANVYSNLTTETEEMKYRRFDSMEKIWLAYIMKQKFNKSWDGEKWADEARINL
jgi:hypothetical protein